MVAGPFLVLAELFAGERLRWGGAWRLVERVWFARCLVGAVGGVGSVSGVGSVAAVILCALGRSSLGRALPDNRRHLPTLSHFPGVFVDRSLTY